MPELEILWCEPRVRQPIVGPLAGQTFEKRFEGVAFGTGFVLCQNLGRGRAVRYEVGGTSWRRRALDGEREARVSLGPLEGRT